MYRGHLCLVFEHGRLERDDYSLHPGEFQADDFSLHLFLVGYHGDMFFFFKHIIWVIIWGVYGFCVGVDFVLKSKQTVLRYPVLDDKFIAPLPTILAPGEVDTKRVHYKKAHRDTHVAGTQVANVLFIPSFFPGLSGYRTGRGGYIAVGNTSRKDFWEPSACAQPQLMRKGDIEESWHK